MSFSIREVALTLAFVTLLLLAKHVPFFAWLPLTEAIGIVCFSFAIYLGVGLMRSEIEAAN